MGDTPSQRLLFDFADPAAVGEWSPIVDRVMGGISCSQLRQDPDGDAVFEGNVSLDRNGGFPSVRSAPGARGKAGAIACLLEVRGDAKRFKLNLLTEDAFDGLNATKPASRPSPAVGTPSAFPWRTFARPSAVERSKAHPPSTPRAFARSAS